MIESEMHSVSGLRSGSKLSARDWKGWLALAWVLWWGSAYVVTVLQARAPRVLVWLQSWSASY